MRRAAHQLFDRPTLFHDPLALRIVGAEAEATLRSDPRQFEGPVPRALRAFMAVRSRYAEDALARAVSGGVRRYVIVGAGLDTFAYRNPDPESALRVIEVDHPATQAWKRIRLAEGGIAIPRSLTFAPVDFEHETLAEGLARAGLASDEPTFFSWLGVSYYLTVNAVLATLAFVASMPAGSEVVFDFAGARQGEDGRERAAVDALASRVTAAGEPWLTFFDPVALADELRRLGFGNVEHLGPEEINARWFAQRTDRLRVGRLSHLMKAGV